MNGLAVMVTAWRRPYYLEPVLESWLRAMVRLDAPPLYRFVIALGQTYRYEQQLALIEELRPIFPVELEIAHQSHAAIAAEGPHQAIGEAGAYIFSDLERLTPAELRLAGAGLWAAKLISTISLFSGPKRFLHRAENA